jgi:hypothetical protein
MVKANKNTKTKKTKTSKRSRAISRVPRSILDGPAIEYAKLLSDPCSGPLVPGPFGDGTGGIISRFEVDQVIDNGATSIGSFIGFVPSALTFYTAPSAIASDIAIFSPFTPGDRNSGPGYNFVLSNAGTYRVLSACLQLYYPGTELNRSGITGVGQAIVGSLLTNPLSLSTTRTLANFVERVPVDMIEFTWRPSLFDLEWTSSPYADPETSGNFARRSAVFASTSGLPLAVGMRVRMVAVVEWMPISGTGQPSIVTAKNSNNTYTEVLNYLDSMGDWAYKGALHVGKTAASLYRGAKTVAHVAYGVGKMAAITMG